MEGGTTEEEGVASSIKWRGSNVKWRVVTSSGG